VFSFSLPNKGSTTNMKRSIANLASAMADNRVINITHKNETLRAKVAGILRREAWRSAGVTGVAYDITIHKPTGQRGTYDVQVLYGYKPPEKAKRIIA
jgi:pyruvate dehydrogenase complex dehydrogenase (E1) component